MLFALIASRRHFYRKASLLNEGFGPGWIAAILLVLISSAWLGFFSYKHVEYSRDLWWHFSFRADAPRFLRASVGVVGLLLLFSIQRLLRPAAEEPDPPTIGRSGARGGDHRGREQQPGQSRAARRQAAALQSRADARSSCTASKGAAGSRWAIRSAPTTKSRS